MSEAAARIPVVIAAEDMISGVTSWALRAKAAFAGHPRYEIRLINCVASSNRSPEFDATFLGLADFRAYLAAMPEAIVIPNFVWPLYEVCRELRAEGKPMRVIGYCRADSEDEYYGPLGRVESVVDRFVAVSPECQRRLRAHLPPARREDVDCLPTGVVVPPRLDRAWSVAPIRLVYAGRMAQRQKRILDLARLAEQLDARNVDYRFSLVGPGREAEDLKSALAAQVASGRVVFRGRVEPAAMPSLFASHDVHVLVSEYEGTSNSMLESMAQGCAQLLTRAANGPDGIVSDGVEGALFAVGDASAMAAAVARWASSRGILERLGRAAYAAAKPYSIESHAARLAAIFDAAFAGRYRAREAR